MPSTAQREHQDMGPIEGLRATKSAESASRYFGQGPSVSVGCRTETERCHGQLRWCVHQSDVWTITTRPWIQPSGHGWQPSSSCPNGSTTTPHGPGCRHAQYECESAKLQQHGQHDSSSDHRARVAGFQSKVSSSAEHVARSAPQYHYAVEVETDEDAEPWYDSTGDECNSTSTAAATSWDTCHTTTESHGSYCASNGSPICRYGTPSVTAKHAAKHASQQEGSETIGRNR